MARLLLRDLTPGTNYKIQLRAVEGDSVSEWSRLFDLPTSSDTVAPDVPVWAIDDFVVNGDTFIATWEPLDFNLDQNKDFDHYEIEFSDGTTATVIRTNNTSYTLTFDQNRILFGSPKATVYARVRAVDAVGNASAWNSQQTATNPPPSAPASITTTALYDSIKVSWPAVADLDVTRYTVQVSTASASTGFSTVYSGMDTEYVHDTTMFGSDHWYRVYAVDKFGSLSTATTSGAIRPKSSFEVDTVAPDMPTGLTAAITNNANGVGARAALAWSQVNPAANDLAGFVVRYRKVGDTNYSQMNIAHEDRAAIIELQSAYQNYEFQIRSFDWMNNESAWTATVTATSPSAGTPGQTVGVASVAGRDSIRYTWTPSTAANLKEYETTFSTSSTFASGNITFKTSTPVLVVSGLTPGTTYYARVRAINTAGTAGAWSATHTKATLAQLTPGDIGAPTTADLDDLVKSYSVEYAVNASETVAPTTGWSTATPTRNPGDFIWTRTVVTYNDNTTTTTNPALLTGNAGAPGADGNDGSDGNDGAPGRGISSTSVTYQVSSSGTTAPTGTWQASPQATTTGQYLWTRTVYTYTDATTDTAYSVAAHGSTGSAGAAGRGITGTVVEYQKHINGTTAPTGTWTTAIPATAPGEFLWTRTITSYSSAPTSVTSYSVAAHGEAGSDGADGVGISNTTVTYQTHSNGTTAPTGAWSSTPTATVAGQFLWTRTVTNYTDASTSTAYAVAAHGADGADGADGNDGAPGRGVSSSAVTYQAHTSGTTAPTGTWTTAVPSVPAGQFLWTRTILTYTDATTSAPVYAVAGFGTNGSNGSNGSNGVSVTAITRYWLRQTAGAGTPATPGNVASPGGSWATTEPDYLAGTELWMMDRISYSNGTYAYTAPAKSSSYTAAVTAITAANGKNKILFSTGDATGTGYTAGDVWYKRDGNGVIIATWEFTTSWQPRTLGDGVLASLNVGKLVSGDIDAALIKIASTGAIQSADYSATLGWKLDSTGLVINKGQVKASTLIGDTIGSSTGTIQIAAGASIVMNGGYIKSNTNSGTTLATAEADGDGFFLNVDGLFIGGSSRIKANALISDTLTSTTITLGTGGVIQGGSWSLSNSGLSIPDGGVAASKIVLQTGTNIMPARQASWEGSTAGYSNGNGFFHESGSTFNGVNLTGGRFGSQKFGALWGAQAVPVRIFLGNSATDYNIRTEAGKTYIFSLYAYSSYAHSAVLKVKWSNGTVVTLDTETLNNQDNPETATRLFGTATAPAGTTGAAMIYEFPTLNVASGISLDGAQVEEKITNSNTPSSWSPPGVTTLDGGMIRTGILTSSNTAQITLLTPVYDENGVQVGFGNPTTITDPNSRPAFNVNLNGDAEFSNMLVRGNVIIGVPSGGANGDTTIGVAKTIGITSGSPNITAGEGAFVAADVGLGIAGTGIPAGATIMSVGVEGNTAVLSANATATNAALAATLTRPARHVSYIKSYNYTEGATGWILRSDGTAELRELAYDSLDGGSIRVGTMRAEALSSGSIEAALTISGSFETAIVTYDVTANRTSGSTTITRTDGVNWEDADLGAGVTGTGIPPGTVIVSYTTTSATMSSAATATSTGTVVSVRRGRKVGISSAGIVLENAAGENIVTLPTDANEAATFKGSIEANDLFVHDEFRMFGVNNSLGQAAELHLNSGQYTSPAPKVTFSYDQRQMTQGSPMKPYSPSDDQYVNNPTGFCWDNTDKKYLFTYGFYGTQVARHWGPGNSAFASDGQKDWGVSVVNAMQNQEFDYAYGGMKVVGNDFYFLTTNIDNDSWRLQRVTRTGMNRSGGPNAGDRTLSVAWNDSGSNMNGYPAFDIYGGNTYIAKLNKDNKIVLYKYNGTSVSSSAAFSTQKDVAGGRIASLNVGTFDMGTTVYAVVTTQNGNSNTRKNYVYTVGTSSFGFTGLDFPLAGGYNTIGAAWIGSSTADTNGHFRSLGMGGTIYEYTKFAHTSSASTIYSSAKWRNTTYNTYGPMSPVIATTVQRRAKLVISAGSSIPNVGGTSPNAVAFYMSTASATRYRLELPVAGVTSMLVENIPTTGLFSETAMASGVPSKLLAGTNLEISGDGFIRTNRMILQSTLDANNVGGNTPPLMVGSPSGNHLRIDGNEIISMASDTSQGSLLLNAGGQTNITNLNVTGSLINATTFSGAVTFQGQNLDAPNLITGSYSSNLNWNTSNGRIRVNTSSKRFKENIRDAEVDTAKVLSLRPRFFERNDDEEDDLVDGKHPTYIGFIAEEAEELGLTKWVEYDTDGKPFGYKYDYHVVALQAVVREQHEEITTLKAENASMKADLEAIKAHLGL